MSRHAQPPGLGRAEVDRLLRRAGSPRSGRRRDRALARLVAAVAAGDLPALHACGRLPPWIPRFSLVWEALAAPEELRPLLGAGAAELDAGLDAFAAIAGRPDPALVTREMLPGIAVAAALAGHPLGVVARRKILTAGDQAAVDAACALAARWPGLAEWCREHELTPTDPAPFFLLTGQSLRHRLADPTGRDTVAAYRRASEDERRRLRAAAAAHGSFSLLTRLEPDLALDGEELLRLAEVLVGRGDWAALWTTITASAPADAVRLARYLPEHEARDPRLFAALRAVAVDDVLAAQADPARVGTLPAGTHLAQVLHGPGQLAVVRTEVTAGRYDVILERYAVPGGDLLERRVWGRRDAPELHRAVLGADGTLVHTDRRGALWSWARGEPARLHDGPVTHLTATVNGWVAVSREELLFGAPGGPVRRREPLAGLGLDEAHLPVDRLVAAGERVALAAGHRLVVTGAPGRSGHADLPDIGAAAFVGDRLVVAHRDRRSHAELSRRTFVDGPDDVSVWVHSTDTFRLDVRDPGTLAPAGAVPDAWQYKHSDLADGTIHDRGYSRSADQFDVDAIHTSWARTPARGQYSPDLFPVPDHPHWVYIAGATEKYGRMKQKLMDVVTGNAVTSPALDLADHRDSARVRQVGVTPDGRHLIAKVATPSDAELRVYDLALGALRRLLDVRIPDLTVAHRTELARAARYRDHPHVRLLDACLAHRRARGSGRERSASGQ
ncbi:hypothetical protein [Streptomyces litchfieldiae]|uniref:Uncharacterized protein n=1 Tax=Streptomyces litchfieldiae TaxID=3075543 RepID=A0ABU2MSU5_9ACTN|nr:hypothetical protein [Streptomyces sp. DSM 44938]MDT0344398.1 hypothetical protein [Streptomyces sp. DSM 44938]